MCKVKMELEKLELLLSLHSDKEFQELLQSLTTLDDFMRIIKPLSLEAYWEVVDACWAIDG